MGGFSYALGLVGGLALFLYGMDSMSRAIQLGAGKRLRRYMIKRRNKKTERTPAFLCMIGSIF